MDALMAALVLSALCQMGDKTPWLAAILADRYRRPAMVAICAGIAFAINYAAGAAAGWYLGALLAPEARRMLLALALLLAGLAVPLRQRAPDRLERWRIGAVPTSLLGLAILAFADRMQFVAAALAAGSDLPWLAAVGATLGALAVTAPAILLGEARWRALPHRAIGWGTGALLAILGIVNALGAWGLI